MYSVLLTPLCDPSCQLKRCCCLNLALSAKKGGTTKRVEPMASGLSCQRPPTELRHTPSKQPPYALCTLAIANLLEGTKREVDGGYCSSVTSTGNLGQRLWVQLSAVPPLICVW